MGCRSRGGRSDEGLGGVASSATRGHSSIIIMGGMEKCTGLYRFHMGTFLRLDGSMEWVSEVIDNPEPISRGRVRESMVL